MRGHSVSRRISVVVALSLASVMSVGFFVAVSINDHNWGDWYLVWNLFLAWLPLLFAAWLLRVLPRWPWLTWRPLVLTALWLAFLPNSFYIVSDLIHIQDTLSTNVLLESVMYESFIITGLLLGYSSLYLVHEQLLKRISTRVSVWLVSLALLVCSFAIYLGRDLRLNSWDLLLSPAALLFDISEPLIDPRHHVDAFTTTLAFFILLGVFYVVAWRLIHSLFNFRGTEKSSREG